MKKFTFNDKTVALGLYWARLSGEKLKAEMAALSEEVNKSFGFTRRVETENGDISYQASLTDNKELKGVISGAAALADKYQDIIFIDSLDEDLHWICAISNHEVLAGGDRIISSDELKEVFEEFLSSFEDSEDLLIVQSAESLEFCDLDADENLNFEDLMVNAEVEKFTKEFSLYKVEVIKSGSSTPILALMAVISLSAMGYHFVGPGFFNKKEPEIVFPSQDQSIVEQMVIERKPKVTEKDILRAAYEEEVQWLREDFNKSSPVKTIMRILAFDSLSSKYVAGWEAKELIYTYDDSDAIRIVWKRTGLGTPISLRQQLTNAASISFKLNGDTAVSTYNVVDIYDNGFGKDFDILGFIKNSNYKHENMMHDLISMGYLWDMKNAEFGERKSPIKGLKNKQKAKLRQLHLNVKTITVGGYNQDDLAAFVSVLDYAKTFQLKKISINLEENFQWSVDGELYEN